MREKNTRNEIEKSRPVPQMQSEGFGLIQFFKPVKIVNGDLLHV